jgi:Holliday junction resolvase
MRSAGSRGPFDLISYNKFNVIFIQCKNHKPTKAELADFDIADIPDFCRKELWFKPCRGKVEVHK